MFVVFWLSHVTSNSSLYIYPYIVYVHVLIHAYVRVYPYTCVHTYTSMYLYAWHAMHAITNMYHRYHVSFTSRNLEDARVSSMRHYRLTVLVFRSSHELSRLPSCPTSVATRYPAPFLTIRIQQKRRHRCCLSTPAATPPAWPRSCCR